MAESDEDPLMDSDDEWLDENTDVSMQRLDALMGPSGKGVVAEACRAAEAAFASDCEELLAELEQE